MFWYYNQTPRALGYRLCNNQPIFAFFAGKIKALLALPGYSILQLMQRALKNQELRRSGETETDTTNSGEFPRGLPRRRNSQILARTSLAGLLHTFGHKSVNRKNIWLQKDIRISIVFKETSRFTFGSLRRIILI